MTTDPALHAAATAAGAHDPDDAVALAEAFGIDTADPSAAMDQLREERPYLFASDAPPPVIPNFDGGARGDGLGQGGRPVQLTRDDLKHMTPDEIVAAKTGGLLDDLMGARRGRP